MSPPFRVELVPHDPAWRTLHAEDSHAYGDCKSAWIGKVEADALA